MNAFKEQADSIYISRNLFRLEGVREENRETDRKLYQYEGQEVIGIITNVIHYREWREEFDLFWVKTRQGLLKGWTRVERVKAESRPHQGYCAWVSDVRYWMEPL